MDERAVPVAALAAAIRLAVTAATILLALAAAILSALAATIGLPLWVSVLADNGGLLVVLANSLWPLTWRVRPVAAAP